MDRSDLSIAGKCNSRIFWNSSVDLFGGKKLIRTFVVLNGFVAQLNRAPDYGSGGFKFES